MVVWTTIKGVMFGFSLQNTLRKEALGCINFAPCWGYSKSMQLATQDKPKEIEMQHHTWDPSSGWPMSKKIYSCFKSIVQYLYSAVTMYCILSWNTMHLPSLVTETKTCIPCSEGPCCTRSPGEAYPYHGVSEEKNQHVLQTSKPHSRD